jgi:hypothetical protein
MRPANGLPTYMALASIFFTAFLTLLFIAIHGRQYKSLLSRMVGEGLATGRGDH